MESTLTSGSILKPLPTVAGGKFPIFVVMIPQESGIGIGGSLSENWPRRPRHFYKISHWRQLRLLIMRSDHLGWMKCTWEIRWRGLLKWVWGVNCWDWTYATIRLKFLLLWAGLDYYCNLTSQGTKGLKDTSFTQYSTRRTRKQAQGSWGSAD